MIRLETVSISCPSLIHWTRNGDKKHKQEGVLARTDKVYCPIARNSNPTNLVLLMSYLGNVKFILEEHFYSKPNEMHNFRVYWISLYVFRTVFPSIIRSSRLYIQHQVYVIQVSWLLASKQFTNLYDIYLMLYVQSWTPDDGRKDRPKHVKWYSIDSKIVHLVGFTVEIYHDARSHERQTWRTLAINLRGWCAGFGFRRLQDWNWEVWSDILL